MKGYEGFRVKTRRVLLGKGPDVYAKAKTRMVNWELNDAVPWVNFLEGEHGACLVALRQAWCAGGGGGTGTTAHPLSQPPHPIRHQRRVPHPVLRPLLDAQPPP